MKRISHNPSYAISKEGTVFSYKRSVPKRIVYSEQQDGYFHVALWDNNKQTHHLVHRLVAEAYLPNPHKLPEVHHIDGNRQNNHVDNLEWITRQANVEEAHAKTYQLRSPTGDLVVIHNLAKFCRDNGLNKGALCQVAKGRVKQHKGWTSD